MIQAWDKRWAVFRDVADFQIEQRSLDVVRVCPHPLPIRRSSELRGRETLRHPGRANPLWNARRPGATPQFTEVPSWVLMK